MGTAAEPIAGEFCWSTDPNWMLLRFALLAAPPFGINPVVPAELMVTDCFLP